ncbi:MAG: aminoglycoside phosphotransferase family protein, partial [Streptomyces sp.]|nr:aminoglycoside phosphotransferase family protein [Streptomyces sp.]
MGGFGDSGELAGLVRDALGPGCRVAGVRRLRGGSRKGVYRVRLEGARDGTGSVVVYRWAAGEDFWPGAGPGGPADALAASSGPEPFLAAQRRLAGLGVRVPRVLLVDGSRRRDAADLAVVEDDTGGSLEA